MRNLARTSKKVKREYGFFPLHKSPLDLCSLTQVPNDESRNRAGTRKDNLVGNMVCGAFAFGISSEKRQFSHPQAT